MPAMYTDEAVKSDRAAPVEQELRNIEAARDRLAHHVKMLHERLAPMLGPVDDRPTAERLHDVSAGRPGSDMTVRLAGFAGGINEAADALGAIMERLEV